MIKNGPSIMRNGVTIVMVGLWLLTVGGCSSEQGPTSHDVHEPRVKSAAGELTWQFAYDDSGRLLKTVDAAGRPTTNHYELDAQAGVRRLLREFPDGSKVTFEFDRFGRRSSMLDASGSVRYEYDGFNHLTAVHREGGPSIHYRYDTIGRISGIELGGGLTVDYAYDFLGRLATIKTPAGSFSYDYQTSQGTIIRTSPNGLRTGWEYRPDSHLQSISHVAADNSILAQFTYAYRSDGLVSEIKEWSPHGVRTMTYEYDTVQRLTGVTDSQGGKISYRYDQFGNRTEEAIAGEQPVSSTYDWAGRTVQHRGQSVTHDAAGNLTSYTDMHGKRGFEFNGRNLLQAAVTDRGKVQYRYDGEGSLIARSADGHSTRFLPDPMADIWRPLLAIAGDGKPTLYIWEGEFPLAEIVDGEVTFFLQDHLGSVRATADRKGTILQRFHYAPFGAPRQEMTGRILQPAFAGLFYDPNAELYLTRTRAYTPQIGRFLQIDPQQRLSFGSAKDLSAYPYCGDDPVNFVDRAGAAPMYADPTSGGPFIPDEVIRDIQSQQIFSKRMFKYLDAWMERHKPGPIVLMVRGMQHRLQQGEAYAQTEFTNQRVLVLPSYESVGVFGEKIDVQSLRGVEDFFRTLIDRATITRNLDLPAVWRYLEEKGYPVIVSIHESGANHDLAKHVPAIISAKRGGQRIPFLVPTSGNIGEPNVEKLRAVDVRVSESVTNARDFVGKVEKPPWQVAAEIPIVGKGIGQIPGVNIIAGESSKIWSAIGALFNGKIAIVPGWGYGLPEHAQHGKELLQIIEREKRSWQAQARSNASDDTEKIKKALEELERKKIVPAKTRQDFFGGGPPGPPGPPGGGRGGGPGGGTGSPGGFSPRSPSNVAGVYLRGAGEALKAFGALKGVALDQKTGQLVLLSEGKGEIDLPPLRLDDVVTVFRSVYERGEAPWVSIDPHPKDPQGPIMLVRHGPGTANTYVGWMLFEADRVMKVYSLGYDNITRRPLPSAIDGYQNLLDLGLSKVDGREKETIWERFWIVPAAVNRRQTRDSQLSLVNVPLKVNTQRMVLHNGKLVPDPDGTSSMEAERFSGWFTDHYEQLSSECDPAGSGCAQRSPRPGEDGR